MSDNRKDFDFARDWRTLKVFAPYLWPAGQSEMRVRVVIALLFLIAAKIANVYVPLIYKDLLDFLPETEGVETAALPLGIIFGYTMMRILSAAFGELRDAVFAKVAQRAIRTVAREVFSHLHALSLRFHLDRQMGGLSRAIERGVKGIEFLLSFMLFNILPTLLEIFLVCGILWSLYDVSYAAVTFVTIVIYITFTLLVTEWRMKFRRQLNDSDDEANTKAVDSLLNYETVKYFNNETHETARFDSAMSRYEAAAVVSQTSLSMLNIGQAAVISAGLAVNMVMASHDVRAGDMTVGDFVLVVLYLIQLYLPLGFLGWVYRQIKQSLVDMESMFTLLDVHREVDDRPTAQALDISGGTVKFDVVKFAYKPDRQILKGISFDIPAGKTVAVVGPSGAGKSTLTRLMFRFYDVTGGAITIDGTDLREITQSSLRAAIGIVPQDTVLFNDTIGYNIRYGRPTASDSEVREAADMAAIHDFISKTPEGYDTVVGERGLKLSGGEKQRVSIARMLLKKPKIMVFDEATSALDTQTEKDIQASLKEVSRHHTTLMIAHRLSTVVEADRIIVLKDGEVAEQGTHTGLIAQKGVYAQMWAQQQEAEQAREVLDHMEEEGV